MVELKQESDPDGLSIYRDNEHIGYVRWHKAESPRIILILGSFGYITLAEVATVLERYEYERGGRQ